MSREFPGRRITVEESAALRIRNLAAAGVVAAENAPFGSLSYPDRADVTQDYKVIRIHEKTWFLLVPDPKLAVNHAQYVEITHSACNYGGCRFWFHCPGLLGRPCARRVSALYLPPGSSLFACRHCHDLTYRSVRTHDSRVDRAARNVGLILDLLDSKNRRHQLVGVAAFNKLRGRLRPRR
jgi:hypothetical protein